MKRKIHDNKKYKHFPIVNNLGKLPMKMKYLNQKYTPLLLQLTCFWKTNAQRLELRCSFMARFWLRGVWQHHT